MHTTLYVLLEWAQNDPRWIILGIILFLPYGIITFPTSMKRYGNKLYGKQQKTLNRQERFANLSYSSDLTLKQFALVMGIAFSFGFFNMWLVGLYVSWSVVIIYSIILYQYYFRWTDKGLKFQAEEQNKKEEKEQKKKEDDEARRKNICKNFYSPF